jgi:hypothetical protein
MRLIHAVLATVGTAVAIASPLHHAAFRFLHKGHSGAIHHGAVYAESVADVRAIVLHHGRPDALPAVVVVASDIRLATAKPVAPR